MSTITDFVPVNVDLPDSGFNAALAAFSEHLVTADADTINLCRGGLSGVGANSTIHVALFFRRSLSLMSEQSNSAELRIDAVLSDLEQQQIKHRVAAVSLVDCGEEYSDPLSDFSVLRSQLEIVAGHVNSDTRGHVYAVDFAGDLETGAPERVFDTETAAFRRHLGQHIAKALSMMNGSIGDDGAQHFAPRGSHDLDLSLSHLEKLG